MMFRFISGIGLSAAMMFRFIQAPTECRRWRLVLRLAMIQAGVFNACLYVAMRNLNFVSRFNGAACSFNIMDHCSRLIIEYLC